MYNVKPKKNILGLIFTLVGHDLEVDISTRAIILLGDW